MDTKLIKDKVGELGYLGTAELLGVSVGELLKMIGSDLKTFDDLEFEGMDTFYNGVKSRMFFDNGYGISVVQHDYSYGGKLGKYEIAVLNSDGDLVYDTKVTNDVVGYLTPDEVSDYMIQIQEL